MQNISLAALKAAESFISGFEDDNMQVGVDVMLADLRAAIAAPAAAGCDPRRTVVTYHTNSSNPRGRKWYRVAEVCEFDGVLYLHRDYVNTRVDNMAGINGATPQTRADAVKLAKAHAEATGNPFVPGIWQGSYGRPMVKG